MALIKQPFIEGLRNPPENRKKELGKIRTWLVTQPHLPEVSDDYIYLFLHSNNYNFESTKRYIDNYFTIRGRYPSLFAGRDIYAPAMQTMINMANLVRLPKLTEEGCRVLMYTVKDPDFRKFVFAEAVKGFCMYNDCVLSEDGLVEGYIVIFDMKGVSLGHLARVSLPHLKAFLVYIQEAHPARIRGIHVLNTANYIHHLMRIVLPLVRSEFLHMVKFHKGCVPEGFPQELLPMEYGGEAPSIADLNQENFTLREKYAPWLLDSERYIADESKRPKKASWWGMITGANNEDKNSEESLEKQKEHFLANLQID